MTVATRFLLPRYVDWILSPAFRKDYRAMPESPEVRKARARKAILSRHRATNDPERLDATRDYAMLSLEQHIEREVAKAPPFTEAQRDRLRALLAPAVKQYAFDIRTEPTAREPAV